MRQIIKKIKITKKIYISTKKYVHLKSREFKTFYHPKLGRYVYRHRGNGLIIDRIMKPAVAAAGAVAKKFFKPLAKKALDAGIKQAGDRPGKAGANKIIDAGSKRLQAAASEKSGDLIRKSLSGMQTAAKREAVKAENAALKTATTAAKTKAKSKAKK